MYSQNDLDEAVAAGAIERRRRRPRFATSSTGSARLPAVDEEQFRLITGFNDIFVSIAAAILLFAVGWIGQSIGQALGLVDRGRRAQPARARRRSPPTAWGLALFFTAKRRMALPSILLLLAFVGGVFAATGFSLGHCVGEPPSRSGSDATSASVAARRGRGRRRRRLAALEAVPGSDHRRRRRRRGRRDRRRPAVIAVARRDRRDARNIILGFVLLLGIGVFLFAMRWDSSDPARVTRRSRRRLLAPPAGGADDRPPGLHPARAQRRQCDDRRRAGRGPALRRARPHRAGDRPPRLAGLGAGLCAVRAAGAVPRSSARSSSTSR